MALKEIILDWLDERIGISEVIKEQLTEYRVPKKINYWYSLGGLALFIFALQILTGIFLLIYYIPTPEGAFSSIQYIMNNVPYGWFIRLIHAIGANMMVAIVMLHMISIIFMGSYKKPRELHWMSGFLLFLLTLGICLSGYLLPWSQLSYWATTVATNSPGSMPVVGDWMVRFARGGYVVGAPTLGRFFALHVAAIPLAMIMWVGIHLFLIRRTGISEPPERMKEYY